MKDDVPAPGENKTPDLKQKLLIRSTLDSQVVSTAYKFKDKLLARQVEMQELIRWDNTTAELQRYLKCNFLPWSSLISNARLLYKLNLYWTYIAILMALQYVDVDIEKYN